jgi:hypothetical protein
MSSDQQDLDFDKLTELMSNTAAKRQGLPKVDVNDPNEWPASINLVGRGPSRDRTVTTYFSADGTKSYPKGHRFEGFPTDMDPQQIYKIKARMQQQKEREESSAAAANKDKTQQQIDLNTSRFQYQQANQFLNPLLESLADIDIDDQRVLETMRNQYLEALIESSSSPSAGSFEMTLRDFCIQWLKDKTLRDRADYVISKIVDMSELEYGRLSQEKKEQEIQRRLKDEALERARSEDMERRDLRAGRLARPY